VPAVARGASGCSGGSTPPPVHRARTARERVAPDFTKRARLRKRRSQGNCGRHDPRPPAGRDRLRHREPPLFQERAGDLEVDSGDVALEQVPLPGPIQARQASGWVGGPSPVRPLPGHVRLRRPSQSADAAGPLEARRTRSARPSRSTASKLPPCGRSLVRRTHATRAGCQSRWPPRWSSAAGAAPHR
jgi:hypothetical protein